MKKILLLTTVILLACCGAFAQKVVYVIDDITVDNFDGSQLKGKIIKDYKISGTGKGKDAVTVHSIRTSSQGRGSFFGIATATTEPDYPNMSFIIDGKKYGHKEGNDYLKKVLGSSERTMKSIRSEQKENPDKNGPKILITTIIETQPNQNVLKKSDLNAFLKIIPGAKTEADGSVSIDGKPVEFITINGTRYTVKKED
ncbi:MAG: hypothetical protein IKS82_06710 [Bacteroidales bacterium]|nr:hypothetical protein [Bacteroidales bacterium]